MNHVTGALGVDLVKRKLPTEWVTRELNPDYGLDVHIEVFDRLPDDSGNSDTLGEHFYAQVKGIKGGVRKLTKTVRSRTNVLKTDPHPTEGDAVDIEVVTYSLDTNELLTIEAMGAAVPALLFVADLEEDIVYFVCLNDYIQKILLPENPDYAEQAHHTIYLPTWNVLDSTDDSIAYIWLLARRGKFYAAFNTFVYQRIELESVAPSWGIIANEEDPQQAQIDPRVLSMIQIFLRENLRLDIWEHTGPGYWSPLDDVRKGYEALSKQLPIFVDPRPIDAVERFVRLLVDVTRQAVSLGRMYEEVVREWRLPTSLAAMMDDTAASKYRPGINSECAATVDGESPTHLEAAARECLGRTPEDKQGHGGGVGRL
ncbi:DUF4365 domain-containing protein [Kineococcus endophyticus]|uniref:DUF4365 domain-containing protein n=1 Tax=Kineococcus endophyticus TaxID=1181883 RepID=A0ABV3P2X6_9ACTN